MPAEVVSISPDPVATAALMAMFPDVVVVRLIVSASVPVTAAPIVKSPATAARLIDFPSVLSCTIPEVVRFPVLVTKMSPPVSLIPVTSSGPLLIRLMSPLTVFVALKLETVLMLLSDWPFLESVVSRFPWTTPVPNSAIAPVVAVRLTFPDVEIPPTVAPPSLNVTSRSAVAEICPDVLVTAALIRTSLLAPVATSVTSPAPVTVVT